jgi:hypothetical protein
VSAVRGALLAASLATSMACASDAYAEEEAKRGDAEITQRLAFIEARLEAGRPAAERWSYGWFTTYVALSVVQFGVTLGTTDVGLREDMAVGAFTSSLGVLPFAIFPFTPRFASRELAAMPEATPAQRARKLVRAEALLEKCADQEAFGKSWMTHVGVIAVNVGIGLGLAFGYDRVKSGVQTTLIGIGVSEFQIFTEPTAAIEDREAYKRGDFARLSRSSLKPEFSMGPMPGGLSLGANF